MVRTRTILGLKESDFIYMIVVAALVLLILFFMMTQTEPKRENFNSTKCFSCEAQMPCVQHGSKCFSCEQQTPGIRYPNKCFSCENRV